MIDTIMGSVITIAVLGYSLFASYEKNMKAHKTTQGKVDSVISTTVKHESEIEKLAADLESLKEQLSKRV